MNSELLRVLSLIKTVLIDNIGTIIATLIGAIVSILTTVQIDKLRVRRSYQKESLKTQLIPYCESIEDAIDSIRNRIAINNTELISKTTVPISYLDVERRICLSKKQRRLLSDYKKQLGVFRDQLVNDTELFIVKYNEWITNRLKIIECLSFKPLFVTINPSISQADIENLIISKCDYPLVATIDTIVFYESDNYIECEKYYFKMFDHIEKIDFDIVNGHKTIYDLSENELIDYRIYRYLLSLDDEEIVQHILDMTKTSDQLRKLEKKANKIRRTLIKQIDRIRGF